MDVSGCATRIDVKWACIARGWQRKEVVRSGAEWELALRIDYDGRRTPACGGKRTTVAALPNPQRFGVTKDTTTRTSARGSFLYNLSLLFVL